VIGERARGTIRKKAKLRSGIKILLYLSKGNSAYTRLHEKAWHGEKKGKRESQEETSVYKKGTGES